MRALLCYIVKFVLLPVAVLLAASLAWLRWDAGRPLGDYFDARHGALVGGQELDTDRSAGQVSRLLRITSSSGLSVSVRLIRPAEAAGPLPVMIVLGGHRTGSEAVDLFGEVGNRAIVALDYPYAGPQRIRGIGQVIEAAPLARRAFIDTPPAVSLVIDWLLAEPWVDAGEVVIVGASLGVPFAALAAARDPRITAALLVHGAADNRAWIRTQVARRVDTSLMHGPLATLVWWLAHGPSFDTAANAARISPRPVLVVGAREDERTETWQTEALFDAAVEPKKLRW
ncbi:MAG: prolyl oligopeptidase family serine peptidase, partial [Gammaproteobacteria bacterium]|nr:prolyl oligopeptidase family serine peptidase [Gammaproteobacteria bacterium]